jgi:hypothetical protein
MLLTLRTQRTDHFCFLSAHNADHPMVMPLYSTFFRVRLFRLYYPPIKSGRLQGRLIGGALISEDAFQSSAGQWRNRKVRGYQLVGSQPRRDIGLQLRDTAPKTHRDLVDYI